MLPALRRALCVIGVVAISGFAADVDQVVEKLLASDADVRRRAALAVADMLPDERRAVISAILSELEGGKVRQRIAALGAIEELGPASAEILKAVLAAGHDPRASVRPFAARAALALRPDSPAVVALVDPFLDGTDAAVQRMLLERLATAHRVPRAYEKTVLKLLAHRLLEIRLPALRAVGRLTPAPAQPPQLLIQSASAVEVGERLAALESLKTWASNPTVGAVAAEATRSKAFKEVIAGVALASASGRGNPAVFESLEGLLVSSPWQISICLALGAYGPPAGPMYPALVALAKDTRASARGDALVAMAAIGPHEPADYHGLFDLADDKVEFVRRKASQMLESVAPSPVGQRVLDEIVRSGNPSRAGRASRILEKWKGATSKGTSQLTPAGEDLCGRGVGRIEAEVLKFGAPDPKMAAAAARAVHACGSEAIPALVKGAGVAPGNARQYALIVLQAIVARQPLQVFDWSPATFSGVGITLDFSHRPPLLASILPGSPAEGAGLEVTDILERIDGRETTGMTETEIIGALRGAPGSYVRLSIRRWSAPGGSTVSVARRAINTPGGSPGPSLEVLGRLERDFSRARPALELLLSNADPGVRDAARIALRQGDIDRGRWAALDGASGADLPAVPLSESTLVRNIEAGDDASRLAAIVAAGNQSPTPSLINALRKALKDPRNRTGIGNHPTLFGNTTLRHAAVLSLGQLGPAASAALPDITEAIESGDGQLRDIGKKALELIQGESETPQAKPSPGPMPPALRGLAEQARIGSSKARAGELVEALLPWAAAGNRQAYWILGRLCPEALPALGASLEKGPANRRVVAARILGEINPLPAFVAGPLVRAASSRTVELRLAAISALANLPPGSGSIVMKALEDALGDPVDEVRFRAQISIQVRKKALNEREP